MELIPPLNDLIEQVHLLEIFGDFFVSYVQLFRANGVGLRERMRLKNNP